MNRCIHCTRCIRFGEEVAGIREMVALKRGAKTEITTLDGQPLQTEYAGNYADICPTGSLTLKDFRFKKRAWMLKKTPTICEGCARGCSMEIHHEGNIIYRCVARTNMEVNKYWICDEGRFNFHYVHSDARIIDPAINEGGSLVMTDWTKAMGTARGLLAGKKPVLLVGSDLTQEEAVLIQGFAAKNLGGAPIFHYGTPDVRSAKDDADADKILKRKNKTSNLHGIEKLGIPGLEAVPTGVDFALVFRGGRAGLPALKGIATIGIGVFEKPQAEQFKAVLPGATFAEKDGTIVNFQGKEQTLLRAVLPAGQSKLLAEILGSLS